MGHDAAELETRLSRCERTLFGDDDSSKGLSSRMHMTEITCSKIEATLARLNWMLITGIVVGIINVLMPRGGTAPASHQSTSVITSDATKALEAAATTHRAYLTTADVAAKEGVSVREVTDMIQGGEIIPPPVKDGREWRIAANYRIQPHSAAECGIVP